VAKDPAASSSGSQRLRGLAAARTPGLGFTTAIDVGIDLR
jgi:hypothetical protein